MPIVFCIGVQEYLTITNFPFLDLKNLNLLFVFNDDYPWYVIQWQMSQAGKQSFLLLSTFQHFHEFISIYFWEPQCDGSWKWNKASNFFQPHTVNKEGNKRSSRASYFLTKDRGLQQAPFIFKCSWLWN